MSGGGPAGLGLAGMWAWDGGSQAERGGTVVGVEVGAAHPHGPRFHEDLAGAGGGYLAHVHA